MSSPSVAGTARSLPSTGWVPYALVVVVLVPAIAGSLRLVELAGARRSFRPTLEPGGASHPSTGQRPICGSN